MPKKLIVIVANTSTENPGLYDFLEEVIRAAEKNEIKVERAVLFDENSKEEPKIVKFSEKEFDT